MAAARVEAPVAFQWSPFPSIFSAVKAWLTLCCRFQFLSAPLLVSVYCVFFAHALDLNLRIYSIDIHTYTLSILIHIYLSSLLSVEYVFWFCEQANIIWWIVYLDTWIIDMNCTKTFRLSEVSAVNCEPYLCISDYTFRDRSQSCSD